MKQLHKNFVFDIVIAVLALALGILMLPAFPIGPRVLNILLAVGLIAYLALYLFGRAVRSRGIGLVLTVVEFSVLALIALGLILKQFKVFDVSSICQAIGVVIWLRGTVCAIQYYSTAARTPKKKYATLRFFGTLALITAGAMMIARPIISDLVFNWVFCILFFVCALLFTLLAILYSPAKKRGAKKSKR